MRFSLFILGVLCAFGCDARNGTSAELPHVAIYPGAKIVSNGENHGVIGANLEISDSKDRVLAFYQKELGLPVDPRGAGNLAGDKAGHHLTVLVTDAGKGKTAVSIIEPK